MTNASTPNGKTRTSVTDENSTNTAINAANAAGTDAENTDMHTNTAQAAAASEAGAVSQQPHRSGFVAVVGRPNVGKSTLINALLDAPLASTEVTPETASLTKFCGADEDYVEVKFYTPEE